MRKYQEELSHLAILVVEDNEDIRSDLVEILQSKYSDVQQVENGIQALEKIHSQDFDLILTDIMMPNLNGIELLKEIAKMKDLDSQPYTIIISGYADRDLLKEALENGANDFIEKPIEEDHFFARINYAHEFIKNRKAAIAMEKRVLDLLTNSFDIDLTKLGGAREHSDRFQKILGLLDILAHRIAKFLTQEKKL